MPIYEYACTACGHTFEEWQKISDEPIRTCPSCKKRKVEKQMSLSSFQLKGGGWYADGYASASTDKNASKGDISPKSSTPEKKATHTKSTDTSASGTSEIGAKKKPSEAKKTTKSSSKAA